MKYRWAVSRLQRSSGLRFGETQQFDARHLPTVFSICQDESSYEPNVDSVPICEVTFVVGFAWVWYETSVSMRIHPEKCPAGTATWWVSRKCREQLKMTAS